MSKDHSEQANGHLKDCGIMPRVVLLHLLQHH